MGELVFIGLGLDGEKGITLRGLDEARSADLVFAELYTSALPGVALEAVENLIDRKIRRLTRQEVEDGQVFFFQAEDGIRDYKVTGVQTCALPISRRRAPARARPPRWRRGGGPWRSARRRTARALGRCPRGRRATDRSAGDPRSSRSRPGPCHSPRARARVPHRARGRAPGDACP